MLGLCTDYLFLEEMSPGLVFRFHFAVHAVFLTCHLIFLVFLHFLQLFVEDNVVLELVFILQKERVLDNVGESHALFAVHYENALEEVL